MENLYFIGDNHNVWEDFKTEVLIKNIRDAVVIQLGDAGYGCYPRRLNYDHLMKQNIFLEQRNIMLYNIRGNHDNPHWFMTPNKMLQFFRAEDRKVPAWQKEDMYYLLGYVTPPEFVHKITTIPNIKFVQDYTVLEINGLRILCIGGAITVDRMMRRDGGDYFRNEKIIYLPNKLKKMRNIDIVATHTMPDFIPPFDQNSPVVNAFRKHDTTLIAELVEERQTMTKMYNDIVANNRPTHWFYGHFHQWNKTIHEDTLFWCLPPNKAYRFQKEV